jgi:hypothetical protein
MFYPMAYAALLAFQIEDGFVFEQEDGHQAPPPSAAKAFSALSLTSRICQICKSHL